jgi:hypothetical protein
MGKILLILYYWYTTKWPDTELGGRYQLNKMADINTSVVVRVNNTFVYQI